MGRGCHLGNGSRDLIGLELLAVDAFVDFRGHAMHLRRCLAESVRGSCEALHVVVKLLSHSCDRPDEHREFVPAAGGGNRG